jgi:excisionase family DNA binding protein
MRETKSGYVRMKELAFDLGVSARTIYRWIEKGTFPAPYILNDKAVGFRIAEVERWKKTRVSTRQHPRKICQSNNNLPTSA